MSTILITGGSGYIGSHTLLELAKAKEFDKFVVFDNLRNGNRKAIDIIRTEAAADIELVEGDLLDIAALDSLFSTYSFDAAIHFAALIEAGVSMAKPVQFFQNNIGGTINLIKHLQDNQVKKLVFSSTAAVYGNPPTTEVTEQTPTNPENWYGYTKLVVEQLLAAVNGKHVPEAERINTVILRYFNAAGSNPQLLIGQDYPHPTHLITVAIQAALGKRDKLTVFGGDYPTADGTCVRDYIHVEDLAKAHVKALNFLNSFNGLEIINVGTGKGSSNLEVIQALEQIHGKFNYEIGPRRAGDPVAYFANNTKAKAKLDWSPQYDLSAIVQSAYDWVKKYPNGFEDIVV
jgi:UDP-glucose 4-epimerase